MNQKAFIERLFSCTCALFSFLVISPMSRYLATLIFCTLQSFGQELDFQHITTEDGLSQNTVFDVTRDKDGFLWVGTLDGLNRYDGYTFQILKHRASDSSSLSANNVWTIKSFSSGKLLVRYQASDLDIINPKTFQIQHFSSIIKNQFPVLGDARGFCEDSNGTLYVSFVSSLFAYSPKHNSVKRYFIPTDGRFTDQIQGVFVDSTATLWIMTLRRVFILDTETGKCTAIPINVEMSDKRLFSWMCKDTRGVLWCGGERLGICYFDKEKNAIQPVPIASQHQGQLSKIAFRKLYFDKLGNCWLGSDAGLYRLGIEYSSNKSPTIVTVNLYNHDPLNPSSISNNGVLSIYEDDENILWVGTASGLNKAILSEKNFHVVKHDVHDPHSLGEGDVWSILEDRSGRTWVATHAGLFRRANGETSFQKFSSLQPVSMSEDNRGRIWIGTRDGMYCWHSDQKPLERIYDSVTAKAPGANFVYSSLSENDSSMWWGTSFGLVKYNLRSKKFKRLFADSASYRMYLYTSMCLCRTSDEYLWIGTNEGGVIRYDTKNETSRRFFSNPSDPFSLSNNVVSCIYEAADKTLWIATFGGGLNKVERNGDSVRFIHFREEEGLKTDLVYGILEDDHGNLWLSTGNSLSRFSPRQETFHHYTKNDGIMVNEFNQNAYHRGRSGKLYVGGNNGFVEFYPDSVQGSTFIPPMAVTQFKIFDEDQSELLRDSIVYLSYTQNFFSFEFSSLSFVAPSNNLYAYKLEGLESDWVQTKNKRFARYTHIDPGNYVFRVKGTNNDGVWNEQGASIRIIISPPWWSTMWFRLFAAFGFIGSISGGAWYVSRRKLKERIAQLEYERALMEERQHTREQIARDLHDEVASTLSSISLYSETVRSRPKKRLRDFENAIEKLSALSSEAKQSMEEVVWSLSPGHETLKNLVDRIGDLSSQWCQDHSLECHLAFCVIPPDVVVNEDVQKNLYLIFKEAMNNIIKYSGASSVELLSWFEDAVFYLSIRDNGKGIDTSSSKEKTMGGHGLKNMHIRAEKIGAILQITSTKDKGTEVSVQVKIAQLRH